jgi:hypothetical protein
MVFGNHKKEWEFDENMSQDKMFEIMNNDLKDLLNHQMNNFSRYN